MIMSEPTTVTVKDDASLCTKHMKNRLFCFQSTAENTSIN